MEKKFKCGDCDYETDKSSNLQRHKKRHELSVQESNIEAEEWLRTDPGDLNELLGEGITCSSKVDSDDTASSSSEDRDETRMPTLDPTVRKPTIPDPVCNPKQKGAEKRTAAKPSIRDQLKDQLKHMPYMAPKIRRPPKIQILESSGSSVIGQETPQPQLDPPTVPKQSAEVRSIGF